MNHSTAPDMLCFLQFFPHQGIRSLGIRKVRPLGVRSIIVQGRVPCRCNIQFKFTPTLSKSSEPLPERLMQGPACTTASPVSISAQVRVLLQQLKYVRNVTVLYLSKIKLNLTFIPRPSRLEGNSISALLQLSFHGWNRFLEGLVR